MSLRSRSVAPGAGGGVVGSDALTRTQRLAGNDRAKLSPGESVRGTSAQGGFRYLEQRSAKPGAGLVRQRGGHAEGHHSYPERRNLLVWWNAVAGTNGHEKQRLQLGHHRPGCRAERSGNDPNRDEGESEARLTDHLLQGFPLQTEIRYQLSQSVLLIAQLLWFLGLITSMP